MARVLVVEDDEPLARLVRETLERDYHEVVTTSSGEEAIGLAREEAFDLVVADVKLPGIDGITMLGVLWVIQPALLAVVVTAFPEFPVRVDSLLRLGFYEYVPKPYQPSEISKRAQKLLASRPPVRLDAGASSTDGTTEPEDFEGLIGASPAMRRVVQQIGRIAKTREPVLILGETGTGKELVARAIHRLSGRPGQFVPLNCGGAGPDSLLDAELFGHERGAYTDAKSREIGWFEAAHQGTLFLDEIAELSPQGQAKLLRIIEARELTRLGGRRTVAVDVRIVAATNADLEALAGKAFRLDLFHRLSVLEIRLPALRDRPGDVMLLICHFLPRLASSVQVPTPTISPEAFRCLLAYPWPGNVRELQQQLKHACINAEGVIEAEHLSERLRTVAGGFEPTPLKLPDGTSLVDALKQVNERLKAQWIQEALDQCRGSVGAAAAQLGISRKTVQRLRRRVG